MWPITFVFQHFPHKLFSLGVPSLSFKFLRLSVSSWLIISRHLSSIPHRSVGTQHKSVSLLLWCHLHLFSVCADQNSLRFLRKQHWLRMEENFWTSVLFLSMIVKCFASSKIWPDVSPQLQWQQLNYITFYPFPSCSFSCVLFIS